jgi:3-hydroxyacyl-CoA dehydrogenase
VKPAGTGFKRACVIGAGVMGSGIAAQIANAGVPVMLLDVLPKDGPDRDAIAKSAIDAAPGRSRAVQDAARLITRRRDDLGSLPTSTGSSRRSSSASTGRSHRKLDAARKKGSIISFNTSTFAGAVIAGLPASRISHHAFFNRRAMRY